MSSTDELSRVPMRGDDGRSPFATKPARRRRGPFFRVLQVVGALLLVFLLLTAVSIGRAVVRPGTDSVSARVAEWARDHGLGGVVTRLEKAQYASDRPKQGGAPAGGVPQVGDAGAGRGVAVDGTPAPRPLPILAAGAALPNEGRWQGVVSVKGSPAVRLAFLRPDDQHTSYLAAVMWLDPRLVSARLHPGTQDPAGRWATPSEISPALQRTVAAAFPAGFRLTGDSRGGYYDQGKTVRAMRAGAASFVINADGSVHIGAWGRDVAMTAQVRSVRQNLDLLVDKGTVNPTCADNNSPVWGNTVGNRSYVPRTAMGQRADGSLVFVNSPATSVCSLGRLLQAAGVVRGMESDINRQWAVGYYYDHVNGRVVPHRSRPDQDHAASQYFAVQSRDFIAFYARS
ncbi:MAG TPA: phosphodiester glycosidase family protein [Frankiaceae bacterium]|nr:phosphodiester glycosidase family protein [Frankiaceae bacterium]